MQKEQKTIRGVITLIIIESKLRVPELSPYLVRERLFTMIDKCLDRSLICLTSPGGYGKTTLVASYLKERKVPAVWYRLAHQDRDPHTFLFYMKNAISRIMHTDNSVREVDFANIEQELEQMVALLSAWSTPLIIVLDNYQAVDQCREVENMLTEMIGHAASPVTFMITSRVRPKLQLVNFKLQNKLAELNTKDLAFTKEEIARFFEQLHHVTLREYETDFILNKTEGWVTSLQLLPELIKDMTDDERAVFWIRFNGTPDIYDYLSTEILDSQPEHIRDFLFKTCLINNLNSSVIDEFLNSTHSRDIIEYLLKNHMFIYQTSEGTVKYHNIFRAFLYKELQNRYSKDEIRALHQKLSLIYQHKMNFINSFAHAVMSGDPLAAARLMQSIKQGFTSSQFLTLVETLSEYFASDYSLMTESFFLCNCIPLEITRDLIVRLESNFNHMKEAHNPIYMQYFQHLLATMTFYMGDLYKAYSLCNSSLQASLKMKDHKMIIKNMALKALICLRLGQYKKAQFIARSILSYPGTLDHFRSHKVAWHVLSETHLNMNDLTNARPLIEETLKLAEHHIDNLIIFPYKAMAQYYRLSRDYAQAMDWIKKAEDIAVQYSWDYDLGLIFEEKALIYLEIQQWENAEDCLAKAYDYLKYNTYFATKVKLMQIKLWQYLGKQAHCDIALKELSDMYTGTSFCWFFPINEIKFRIRVIEEKKETLLSITTLGTFQVSYKGKKVSIKRKSSLRMLQYFIVNYTTKKTKDQIVEALFPERSLKSAYSEFYVALSQLRKTLESDLSSGRDSRFIKQTGEHYYLSLDDVDLDVSSFSQLIQHYEDTSSPQRIELLQKAVQLYRGDFFEEYPYEEFLEIARQKLRNSYLRALYKLACYYWERSNYQRGIEYFEACLYKDPLQEDIYQDYIKRLLESGLSIQAKRVSNLFNKYVQRELKDAADDKVDGLISQSQFK
jgi:LuxR family maltose regulon positive regulatory protein